MERSDTIGLSVAAAAHVLLLAALSFGLLSAPPIVIRPPDAIDVTFADAVALESGTRNPAPATASQAPETGPTEDAAPPPAPERTDEPQAKPLPTPAPAPPPPKPAEPKPAPLPKPAPRPTPKPTPTAPKAQPTPAKPAPAKPQAAKASPAKAAPAKPRPATGNGEAKAPRGSRLGNDFLKGINSDTAPAPRAAPAAPAKLSDTEARALNVEISRQLKPYWRAPSGADADQLATTLRWRLNPDGTLAAGPDVVSQTGITDSNRPQADLHREAAIRAVRAAAPFQLPPEFYPFWKNIVAFRFDKRL